MNMLSIESAQSLRVALQPLCETRCPAWELVVHARNGTDAYLNLYDGSDIVCSFATMGEVQRWLVDTFQPKSHVSAAEFEALLERA